VLFFVIRTAVKLLKEEGGRKLDRQQVSNDRNKPTDFKISSSVIQYDDTEEVAEEQLREVC